MTTKIGPSFRISATRAAHSLNGAVLGNMVPSKLYIGMLNKFPRRHWERASTSTLKKPALFLFGSHSLFLQFPVRENHRDTEVHKAEAVAKSMVLRFLKSQKRHFGSKRRFRSVFHWEQSPWVSFPNYLPAWSFPTTKEPLESIWETGQFQPIWVPPPFKKKGPYQSQNHPLQASKLHTLKADLTVAPASPSLFRFSSVLCCKQLRIIYVPNKVVKELISMSTDLEVPSWPLRTFWPPFYCFSRSFPP